MRRCVLACIVCFLDVHVYSAYTKGQVMLYLDAALLALVVVRESRSFLSTQVQAVVSSCRSTNRSQPRIIAPAVAAFDAIVRRRRRKSRLNAAAIFSCLLLFFPRTLSAQANASGLSMSVKDPQ